MMSLMSCNLSFDPFESLKPDKKAMPFMFSAVWFLNRSGAVIEQKHDWEPALALLLYSIKAMSDTERIIII